MSSAQSGSDSVPSMSDIMRAMAEMQVLVQQQQQQIQHLTAASAAARPAAAAQQQDDDNRSSASSSSSIQRARIERKQLAVTAPNILMYDKASSSGALEDWIDGMELLFHQLGVEDDEARLAEVRVFSDRDVRAWWEGQQQQAVEDGAPIDTWDHFLSVLREQFLPQSEAHEATAELINIRQQAGEAMEKYFLRATRMFARTRGGFPDQAAMLIVLERVRKDEWRHALAVATRDVQAGKITTLAQLRACLQREALAEPGKQRQQGNGGAGAAGQQKSAGAGGMQKKPATVRAAAATRQQEEQDEDKEWNTSDGAPGGTGTTKAAAAQQRSREGGDRCLRCKEYGHRVKDCTKPDKRLCYVCGEVGHISAGCPKRAAGSNGAQSKNE